MKVYPDTKVYIICPGNYHTGGVELLHQLCSQLIQFNINAYMAYINSDSNFNADNPIDPFYKKYHLPYAFNGEDNDHNVIIIPETSSTYLYDIQKMQRVFWWMSVDNYVKNIATVLRIHANNPLAEPMPKVFYFDKTETNIEHWVQSEYARQFVKLNGVPDNRVYMVEDYLNQAFLSRATQIDLSQKQNWVAFNPVKGFEVTKLLMQAAPDITWKPIQNMTPEQVQELLAKSKVYIDFGNHPGKDRIPREAALSGCVVITNMRGAAANDVDINIPAEFKFDENKTTSQKITEKIRDVFNAFESAYDKQADYRKRILDDKNRFANEVAQALRIKSNDKFQLTAITQGFSKKGYTTASILLNQQYGLTPAFMIDDIITNQGGGSKYITFENNEYYLNMKTGQKVPIISSSDARFLYQEGRIKKFALLSPDENDVKFVREKLRPARNEDVIVFNNN